MPTINKMFLLKLVLVIAGLTGVLFGVHAVQADRIPSALKRQAERATEANKPDEAIHYLRQYLEFAPSDIDVQIQLVELLRKRNPTPRGLAEILFLYDRILRIDPDRHAVRREALWASLRTGRYSDAVIHAELLLKAFPAETQLWQLLGAAQTGLHQLSDARKSYETIITLEPDELIGYQRLAQLVWRDMNDIAGVREVLDHMVKAAPQIAEAYLIRARFDAFTAEETTPNARGDVKRAIADSQRVLELDPENAEALVLLADLFQRERKIPAALTILRDAVALYPRDLRLVRNLSWLELMRGNAPAAIDVLEDGLKATPGSLDLLIPLADLLLQQGDVTRTKEILKRLENGKASPVQVKYIMARLAMRDNRWTDATAMLEALRTEINNLPALETQLNLLLAVCTGRLADPVNEEKAYQRVINAEPKNVQARVGLGNLYLTLGRFDDATREFEAVVQSLSATGAIVAQWARTKTHRLRMSEGSPEEWRKLEQTIVGSSGRFGAASSEPIILLAEVGFALGKKAETVQLLRKEAVRRPGDARLWAMLAETVAATSGTAAGLTVVDEAQAAAGDSVDVRLVRAKLYVGEPGRLRPLASLVERIESWPENEQLRLLFGMVEMFDRAGDQAAVVKTLRSLASRCPSDAAVWIKLHERGLRTGDAKAVADARAALVKIEGESGPTVLLCDAATAEPSAAAKMIDRMVKVFGTNPVRSDACLALARLFSLTGHAAEAACMTERAFNLEPTRYEAALAWLIELCHGGDDDKVKQFVARLANDPRWAGDPFRRLIAAVVPKVQTPVAAKLLNWSRPFVEREQGGLGWLAEIAAAHRVFDPTPLLEEAVQRKEATGDDWLRLALIRQPADLNAARGKIPQSAFFGAVAILIETSVGKDFAPETANSSERRIFSQCRLAVKLARGKSAEAVQLLESYLAEKDVGPADAAWGRRILAMLYAVGGTPEDRRRAMGLIKTVNDSNTTPEELRATASVLTTLGRYLEGADRAEVLNRAAAALDAVYKAGNSPKDLYDLSQLYRADGNRSESRKCLQTLLNADPKNIYYLVTALEELVEDRNFAVAETFAKKLLEEHPGEFRAVAAVARYECQAGRPTEALSLAEAYVGTADPGGGDHLTQSGRAAELLDELSRLPNVRKTAAGHAMAKAAAERFAALVPNHPEAVVGVVGVLAADGRVADAFAKIEQFDRYLPARVRAAAGLAIVRACNISERQAAMVRGWLDGSLAEEPDSLSLKMNRAEFLTLRQDLDGAVNDYETVLAADPRNVVALNNFAWVLAADPRTAERALELVARATREVGLTGDLLDTRARVRITLKQFAEAERDLNEAIRLEPTALRWFHLAVSRLVQTPAKTDDAAKAFTEAKRRGLEPRGVHPADRATYDALDAGKK